MKKVPATKPVHQAPDTPVEADAAVPTRKQVSKRTYIDAKGAEVDKIEDASGARYTLLGVTGGNRDFDLQIGEAGKPATMCGILGFQTKAGNVANTVLNDKDDEGTPDDAGAAIEDWIAKMQTGVWAERTTGGVGARIDKDALADSVFTVAGGEGKSKKSLAEIRARLESDPTFVRQVRQVPAVAKEYAQRTGKATKTVDELLTF